nr:enoyl-CoA hydratase/isomerase family protein [uncultured Pseudogulbenkiania sp.]
MSETAQLPVLYAVQGGVATITLNRPQARNALNRAMCEDLLKAVMAASEDETVRLVLIKANGPVFCAGADLKERKGMSESEVRARRLMAFAAYDAIEKLPMPSVAVVQGSVTGSGVEISGACDFIIASDDTQFWTPEAQWGTIGATQRLPRVLGKRLAKDLMFTGRRLSAAEAQAAGLVARIASPEQMDTVVAEVAASIIKAPPGAMRLAKRTIDQGLELDPKGALAAEILAIEENLARNDWRSGIKSFGSAQ